MIRCPNCFYELALLEKRRKYKCAKCGKLFPQKEIENKEFREWNKKRRKEERDKVNKELELRKQKRKRSKPLSKEEWEEWMRKKLEKSRKAQAKYREENREEYNAKKKDYWAWNKKRLTEKRRENYEKRKPQISAQQKLYRENNKVLRRINALRYEQKLLAVKMFEINLEKASTLQIQKPLPIILLS